MKSDRALALAPFALGLLRLLPQRFHLFEAGVFGASAFGFKTRLDNLETADEFGVGGAKRVFRVELEMAGEVGHREQQIAEFLRNLGGLS